MYSVGQRVWHKTVGRKTTQAKAAIVKGMARRQVESGRGPLVLLYDLEYMDGTTESGVSAFKVGAGGVQYNVGDQVQRCTVTQAPDKWEHCTVVSVERRNHPHGDLYTLSSPASGNTYAVSGALIMHNQRDHAFEAGHAFADTAQ